MKRILILFCATLALLVSGIGLLRAQQDGGEAPERVYPSALPARYNLIIDRGIFGYFPREDIIPDQQQPETHGAQPLPGTLPEFQHDPGTDGNEIPSGPLFSLTAVIQVGDTLKAIVVDNVSEQGLYVVEGDTISGYTVSNIGEDRVVLSNGDEQIVLKIDVPPPPSNLVPEMPRPKAEREPVPEPDINRLPAHVQPRIGR